MKQLKPQYDIICQQSYQMPQYNVRRVVLGGQADRFDMHSNFVDGKSLIQMFQEYPRCFPCVVKLSIGYNNYIYKTYSKKLRTK